MSVDLPNDYQAQEQSPHLAVAYCYILEHDDGTRLYWTSFDRPLAMINIPPAICPDGAVTFTPAQIRHGNIQTNDKFEENSCNVSIDSSDRGFRRFMVTAAAVKLRCWILRIAQEALGDEVNFATSVFVAASGILSKFAFSGLTITAEVTPDPFNNINFQATRFWFQRQCNHALYGAGCRVDKNLFSFLTTITAVDRAAQTIIIAGRPAGAAADYFTAGMFDHPVTGLKFAVAWSDFEGTADMRLKLGYWHPEIAVGQELTAYAGCRHTTTDCQAKFHNEANYGGFPYVPNKNPVTNGAN